MSVGIATHGYFNPSIGTGQVPTGGGGGGGISFIPRDRVKPIVRVSRVRHKEEEEIIVTVIGIEEV
jgi:hypothetical protein